ncbi:hypothetical protein [Rhodococcus sp. B50]|uniref:hypothetical protein n=1 Tax=Rhodococcus sp. B50 TaxID=2682847 RepID=UPI0019ECA7B9|nr:hypothetical protein [Rhodococcus sp. B50]
MDATYDGRLTDDEARAGQPSATCSTGRASVTCRRQATAEDMMNSAVKPIYAVWSVLHFPDSFLQATVHEAPDGVSHVRLAMSAPRVHPQEVEPISELCRTDDVLVDIDYVPGTRRPSNASIKVGPRGPMDFIVEVEPRSVFQMKGLGYYHPQRGQGRDHGRESVLRVQWRIADLDPIAREKSMHDNSAW